MLIKPDLARFAKIKVIGVGGGGGNTIASMIATGTIQGVDFAVVNTDAQVLLGNPAETKIQIGENLTKGLGSGGDPIVGQKAAEESISKIQEKIADADMVFVCAGMGGGTGTGASSIVCDVAKKAGALTVAVVTKPFSFEGTHRMVVAEEGIASIKDKVDALIVIPNQRILEVVDKKVTLLEAFKMADSVVTAGVQGISDLIVMPGLINVDFADVRAIMTNAGSALMGIGNGKGENKASIAARQAVSSPLLEVSIEGAKGVLFNVIGGPDMTMSEVDDAAKIISAAADPDAKIIFGATIDESLVDQMKVTVIATGFDETRQAYNQVYQPPTPFRTQTTQTQTQSQTQATDEPEEKEEEKPVMQNPQPNAVGNDDFSDDIDIPAFLRRKK